MKLDVIAVARWLKRRTSRAKNALHIADGRVQVLKGGVWAISKYSVTHS